VEWKPRQEDQPYTSCNPRDETHLPGVHRPPPTHCPERHALSNIDMVVRQRAADYLGGTACSRLLGWRYARTSGGDGRRPTYLVSLYRGCRATAVRLHSRFPRRSPPANDCGTPGTRGCYPGWLASGLPNSCLPPVSTCARLTRQSFGFGALADSNRTSCRQCNVPSQLPDGRTGVSFHCERDDRDAVLSACSFCSSMAWGSACLPYPGNIEPVRELEESTMLDVYLGWLSLLCPATQKGVRWGSFCRLSSSPCYYPLPSRHDGLLHRRQRLHGTGELLVAVSWPMSNKPGRHRSQSGRSCPSPMRSSPCASTHACSISATDWTGPTSC
jgi:hypothetical protein